MEIATLTAFLTPFLPSLLKFGGKAVEKATESASGKLGEAAFEKAQAVWAKLSPKGDGNQIIGTVTGDTVIGNVTRHCN